VVLMDRSDDEVFPKSFVRILCRVAVFFFAYFGAVLITVSIGNSIWPEGLDNNLQNIFWPAVGVALYLTVRFGPPFALCIFLSMTPVFFFTNEPTYSILLGATANFLEVMLAWFLLVRVGRFDGDLGRVRPVLALAGASLLGGLLSSGVIPLWATLTGFGGDFQWDQRLLVWLFSNACGMVLFGTILFAFSSRRWCFRHHYLQFAVWLLLVAAGGYFALEGVYREGINYAFLLFPVVLFGAIRFGPSEYALGMVLVAANVYLSLFRHGTGMTEAEVIPVLQFLQAFVWVLATSGLLVAALAQERRESERAASEREKRMLEAQLGEEQARLEALRYQLNPHFLFNSLNSINAGLSAQSQDARNMLGRLADYLRSILNQSAEHTHPLHCEMDLVRQYTEIEKQRFKDHLQVSFESDPSILNTDIGVLLLQPLVENAIKHGMRSSREVLRISVRASAVARGIELEVLTNRPWVETMDGQGIGLANVRKRLNLQYGNRAEIYLDKQPDQSAVRILLLRKT